MPREQIMTRPFLLCRCFDGKWTVVGLPQNKPNAPFSVETGPGDNAVVVDVDAAAAGDEFREGSLP